MEHSFKSQGRWSLPGIETNEVHGTLHFDLENSTIELSLLGKLEEIQPNKGSYQELIVGTDEDGKEITLFQCTSAGFKVMSNGIKTSRYTANVIFIGAHFSDKDDLKFDSISCNFSNFFEWVGVSGAVIERTGLGSIRLEYNRPNEIEVELSSELTAKFSFGYRFPFLPGHTFSLTQLVSFNIFSKEEAPFSDFVSNLFHFKSFLSLAQFESLKPTSIYVRSSRISDENLGRQNPRKIDVYLFGDWPKSPKSKARPQMLFSYEEIKLNFASIIRKWYEIKEKLSPSLGFFVDSVASDRVLTENSFLNIIQSVETFHRRFRKNKVRS